MPISAEDSSANENTDPAAGNKSGLRENVLSAFPAFRSRNFKLYFTGQIVSMVGTWLQMVAQGWLVLEIANSPFYVGVVAAASTLPTLFLSLIGGVIVDRYSRKTILLWTQAASMVLAFILGIFTVTGTVTIAIIIVLAFLLGCVTALSTPAIQAFLSEMVDREQLHSAVALNAAIFNASRVIGPAIAGLMISWIGTGGAFIANGLSFLAVIAALRAIRTTAQRKDIVHQPPLQSIKEGLVYAWEHPLIRTIILFVSVVSIFGWSFMAMLPVVAKHTFGLNASGMGYLFSAFGLGSLSGTVLISMYSAKIRSSTFVIGGISLFSTALICFTFSGNVLVAMFFLFIAGIGMLSAFATMTATVQRMVDDRYRGRVMSLYLMVLMGFMPIGNLEVGFLSEHFGTAVAIRSGCAVVLLATIFLWSHRHDITKSWEAYDEKKASGLEI